MLFILHIILHINMISYDSAGGLNKIQNADFFIPFATLNSQTSYALNLAAWAFYYVFPVSFFCYNYTNDTIDKVIFQDDYFGNNFTHMQDLVTDTPTLFGFFNQGGGQPTYSPIATGAPIVCGWSNLGHTYTSKGLYIRIYYYLSTKFW